MSLYIMVMVDDFESFVKKRVDCEVEKNGICGVNGWSLGIPLSL